jgi:hypothetical protein
MREYHESDEENELEIIHNRKNVLKQQIQLIEDNDIESANIENPQSYFQQKLNVKSPRFNKQRD